MVGAAALDPAPLAASSYSAAFLVENLSPGAGELGGTEYSVQEELQTKVIRRFPKISQ